MRAHVNTSTHLFVTAYLFRSRYDQEGWELLIIRNLRERPWRFNELRRDLEGISQKVLTDSLRQMEDDGLVFRHDYGENPPRVEYGLTELGRQMMPVIDSLADFGVYYKAIAS